MRILVGLLVLFALEIASIVAVTTRLGGWATLGLIVVAAVAGFLIMRHAGRSWWEGLRTAAGGPDARGVTTSPSLPDGAQAADRGLLFLSGLLIATPGFVGDGLGLLLLLPFVRTLLRTAAAAWFTRRFISVTGPGGTVVWRQGRASTVHVTQVVRGDVVEGERGQEQRGPGGPRNSTGPGSDDSVIRGEILPGKEESG